MNFYSLEENPDAFIFKDFNPKLRLLKSRNLYIVSFALLGISLVLYFTNSYLVFILSIFVDLVFLVTLLFVIYVRFNMRVFTKKVMQANAQGKTIKITGKIYSPEYKVEISK